MPVLDHLRVSIENALTGRFGEFDDEQSFSQSTIVLSTLPGFKWRGANDFIVTVDFDEGIKVNQYELYFADERILGSSHRSVDETTTLFTCIVDSLVLPRHDIHQRFRFRFIEIQDEQDHEDYSDTKPTSRDFQGHIRIEVRRVKIEGRRNTTTPEFGQPKDVKRARKALLQEKQITHEVELIPGKEVDQYMNRPFRAIAVGQSKVGMFIFRYSGVGTLKRVGDGDTSTSVWLQESDRLEPAYILRDAYQVYGSEDLDHVAASRRTGVENRKTNARNKSRSRFSARQEAAEMRKLTLDNSDDFEESDYLDETTVSGNRGKFIRQTKRLRKSRRGPSGMNVYGHSDDLFQGKRLLSSTGQQREGLADDSGVILHPIRTNVAQEDGDSIQDAEAARVPKLASSDLIDFNECVPEELAQLETFGKELNTLGAHIAVLKRRLEERQQEVAGVLQRRNELYNKLAERRAQSVARLQAEIEEDSRMLYSKKRKLDQVKEQQAQLREIDVEKAAGEEA